MVTKHPWFETYSVNVKDPDGFFRTVWFGTTVIPAESAEMRATAEARFEKVAFAPCRKPGDQVILLGPNLKTIRHHTTPEPEQINE